MAVLLFQDLDYARKCSFFQIEKYFTYPSINSHQAIQNTGS